MTAKVNQQHILVRNPSGHNGRGYTDSTRMAGYTTNNTQQDLEHNANNTVIITQIEDVDALDQHDTICQLKA